MLAVLTLLLSLSFALAPLVTSPFSGFEADQLPIPQVDPPIQPAGWAFSIWGLIYGWLVVSAAYGLWRRRGDPGWQAVRRPLIVALAVGTPWLAIANVSPVWATITILIMALAAVAALLEAPAEDRWLLRGPIALFAGWLTAASLVSIGTVAAGYGLVTGPVGWAYLGLALAALIAWAVQSRTPEPLYGVAVAWALLGIVVRNLGPEPGVAVAAAAALLLVSARAIAVGRRLS